VAPSPSPGGDGATVIRVHTGPVALGLREEWEALCDRAGADPFSQPGWLLAWWNSFGRGDLTVFAARDGGRLRAVLPMARRAGDLSSPTNWQTPSFGVVAEDAGAAAEVGASLFGALPRRVAAGFIDLGGPTRSSLVSAAVASGYRTAERTLLRSPFVVLRGSWEGFRARLGRKRHAEFRRRRRRLEERGRMTLEVMDGSEGLDALLDEGFRVEASGWKSRAGTAIGSRPDTRRFYTDVAGWAASRGWLRLAFLRVGGRAVAFDFCLERDGVHYLLKTGFDQAFRTFGPGLLMRHEMFSRAFALGLREYDFVGTDDPWKLEWADERRERILLEAFRSSPAGLAEWAVRVPGRRAAARARRAARKALAR